MTSKFHISLHVKCIKAQNSCITRRPLQYPHSPPEAAEHGLGSTVLTYSTQNIIFITITHHMNDKLSFETKHFFGVWMPIIALSPALQLPVLPPAFACIRF